jgi:hypothetical protein
MWENDMTPERYNALMNWDNKGPNLALTDDEIEQGWHWCADYDFLLVGPGMEAEQAACNCFYD